jgi:hypothetical protein
MKGALNRALNASYLDPQPQVVGFLFRLLRHFILDPETFEICKHEAPSEIVWQEFTQQFAREFHFKVEEHGNDFGGFDLDREWSQVKPLLVALENEYPILRYWVKD